MRIFKVLFDFYLDSSIHVAFAALSFVWISCMSLDIPVDNHLLIFTFTGSVAVYNFIKYGVEAEKYLLVTNTYHKRIQFISILSLAAALYHVWFLNMNVYVTLGVIAVLVGLYALPVLPKASKLRNWGISKVIIIGVVWAIASVLLPVIQENHPFSWDVWVVFIQRILFVLAWILPFEIRDLAYDSPNLRTLPQSMGPQNTKIVGTMLLAVVFLMCFLKDYVAPMELQVTFLMLSVLLFFIWASKRKQRPYYASFFVEGIPLLWMGIWWLLLTN